MKPEGCLVALGLALSVVVMVGLAALIYYLCCIAGLMPVQAGAVCLVMAGMLALLALQLVTRRK